jgi:hypothetical protein
VNPYVFFVGCPRSGTTLLRWIADSHPELAVARGNRWIARTFEHRRGLTDEGLVTSKLVERLRDPHRLERLGIDQSDLERASRNGDGVPFATFVTCLYDLYGARRGKRLVGEKTPGFVRHIPTLHRLWPEAKFVHLIRDGRDIHLSVLDWRKGATGFSTFGEDPAMTTGVWWEWYVRTGLDGGSELGPGLYLEMRYESLVAEPERECARLCEFLAIDFDPRMLHFHEVRTVDAGQRDGGHPRRPITPGLRSWRTQMSPGDVIRFEAAAGDLLERLGYERMAPNIADSDLERAMRVRETFAREVEARGSPLPRAWSAAAPTH